MVMRKTHRLVYGVGINDLDYPVNKKDPLTGKMMACPFYSKWASMLERGYCPTLKSKYPTYKDVTVCDEWLTTSNFKAWMEKQPWEGNQLDKDILSRGNKEYNPDTCAFIPTYLNTLLLTRTARRGKLLLGVNLYSVSSKTPYRAQVSNPLTNNNIHLGLFADEQQAHFAWQSGKAAQIMVCISMYRQDKSYLQNVEAALVERSEFLLECSRNKIVIDFI